MAAGLQIDVLARLQFNSAFPQCSAYKKTKQQTTLSSAFLVHHQIYILTYEEEASPINTRIPMEQLENLWRGLSGCQSQHSTAALAREPPSALQSAQQQELTHTLQTWLNNSVFKRNLFCQFYHIFNHVLSFRILTINTSILPEMHIWTPRFSCKPVLWMW